MKISSTFSSYSLLSNCKKIGEKTANNLGRFTVSAISNLVSIRVSNLAIPLFLLGMCALPKADAGPVAYGICVIACEFATVGWGLVACLIGCAPLAIAPTP
ncbi:MAG: hypothetical protein WCP39_05360 [Chlamydiota bacterium]